MNDRKHKQQDAFFQNTPEYFQKFTGPVQHAETLDLAALQHLDVAIIGSHQNTIAQLHAICAQANRVQVFQIEPPFILPETEKGIHRLISHPILSKNRRLLSQRIKAILAIRFLESQVKDHWLCSQLMPNSAMQKKVFYKSDEFYQALQLDNCQLITWPITKIEHQNIHTIDRQNHHADVIIQTF